MKNALAIGQPSQRSLLSVSQNLSLRKIKVAPVNILTEFFESLPTTLSLFSCLRNASKHWVWKKLEPGEMPDFSTPRGKSITKEYFVQENPMRFFVPLAARPFYHNMIYPQILPDLRASNIQARQAIQDQIPNLRQSVLKIQHS